MTTQSSGGVKFTDEAMHVYQDRFLAGERNIDSEINSYVVTRNECNLSIISKTEV